MSIMATPYWFQNHPTCDFWGPLALVANQPHTLRDYSAPPVVETVLGVQFAPLSFAIPHFGLYWSRIQSEFPQYRVLPPLGHVREQFGSSLGGPIRKMGFEVVQGPDIRCWFLDRPGDRKSVV